MVLKKKMVLLKDRVPTALNLMDTHASPTKINGSFLENPICPSLVSLPFNLSRVTAPNITTIHGAKGSLLLMGGFDGADHNNSVWKGRVKVKLVPVNMRIWLVVWSMDFMIFHILGIILPTDEHIFQRG